MSSEQEELYDEEEEEEEELMEEEDQEFHNSLEEAQAQDNTTMSISWATERQEISKYGPQVKSGVVNASTSAKHADGIPFEVFPQDAGLSEFFPEDPGDDFGSENGHDFQGIMGAFTKLALSETQLRDNIYSELKRQDLINVPQGCGRSEVDDRIEAKFFELDLNHLFSDIAKDLGLESVELQRFEQALIVTSTSKPDLSTLTPNEDFKIGECEHGDQYEQINSSRQGFLYMFAFIYWLRVKQGLPVNTVYGFGICGPKCKDHVSVKKKRKKKGYAPGEYSVGLFKLVAPTTLGGVFTAKQFWKKCPTNDETAMKLLTKYFREGNKLDLHTATPKKTLENRAPCLFALPRKCWEDTDERELVVNGTSAIIFKLSLYEITRMTEDLDAEDQETQYWITAHFSKWAESQTNGPAPVDPCRKKFYLKVRTEDMSSRFGDSAQFSGKYATLSAEDSDFGRTYPLPPLCSGEYSFIVMNDQGKQPTKSEFKTANDLKSSFREMKTRTEKVDQYWCHGDLLYHNLTVTSSSGTTIPILHFIDYDEGTFPGKIVRRENASTTGEHWFSRLVYPNPLRLMKNRWYCRVQLATTLMNLILMLEDDSLAKDYNGLRRCAKAVSDALDKENTVKKSLGPGALQLALNSLEGEVNRFLGNEK